ERTPYNDPNARGVFFGIRSDTDAVELAVAVLEGVALAFADGLDVLLEKGGSINAISVTGGGARLPYWGQLLAAALNRPLTYRVVLGKRMEEWLKVAVCYWHSFNWPGQDIFGGGTLPRPWLGATISQQMADTKLEAAFDFFQRLGVPYFTFHDVDAMATATTL